ncbi:HD-GYP domain-containing protein [Sulfurimonas sp.]|uniref:HD-GYP domain-containing protein n=1 Tax=Sulfurimonas sp. TaxID=2022749 RepID=UPI003567E9AA
MKNENYKILIVDDVQQNVLIVKSMLEKEGFRTEYVHDGISALKLVEKEKFDLILLDVMMPKINGIDTCRYLKIEPNTASIPVIFITGSDDKESLKIAYDAGGVDYIKKPFFKEELIARVKTHLKLKDYEKNLEQKVVQKTKESMETQVKLMYTLGGIAEGHSIETQKHVRRVGEFAYKLGLLYGLKKYEAIRLKHAAYMHDIGKLSISDSILHKNGILNKKERKEMNKHAKAGADMLGKSELPLFKTASIVCEQHHEKYDGTGYPHGLKASDIHIYGRIVAIADVFDALLFRRSYKESWHIQKVLDHLKDMRGKHFDPKLIDLFFNNLEDFLEIYQIELEKVNLKRKKKFFGLF